MYQHCYYSRRTNTMHIWDDEHGYVHFEYEPYAYKPSEYGEYVSLYGDRLEKVESFKPNSPNLFESDVIPETRTLIDLYETSDELSKDIIIQILDIEVKLRENGLADCNKGNNTITAIGWYDNISKKYHVFILDEKSEIESGEYEIEDIGKCELKSFLREIDLILNYLSELESLKPHIVTGWNINGFDMIYLYNRIKRVLGEDQADRLSQIGECYYNPRKKRLVVPSVSCLDYLPLYKKFSQTELSNYRLDTVSKAELGYGKLEYDGDLDSLLKTDIKKFLKYNLYDIKIVKELEDSLKYIDLTRQLCHIGHVPYENIEFSSRYLEGCILLYLRKKGLVAPNKMRIEESDENDDDSFEGAYVKQPIPGIYDWVVSCDINSLYPSTIRTLNISPETKVGKILNWSDFKPSSDE